MVNVGKFGHLCRLPIVTIVAGCAAFSGNSEFSTSLDIGTDNQFYIPAALTATSVQFFGGGASVSGGGPSSGAGFAVDIEDDLLTAGSATRFSKLDTKQITVSLSNYRPLGDGFFVKRTISAGTGNSSFFLPDGVGVFIDPITIRFKSKTVRAEIGIGKKTFKGRYYSTQIEGGGGVHFSDTFTTITSALLDVENHSQIIDQYMFTEFVVNFGSPAPGRPDYKIRSRLNYYRAAGLTFQSAVSVPF